jgi:hypothetical protein
MDIMVWEKLFMSMINSQISLNDVNQQIIILTNFLEGTISLLQLKSLLEGILSLVFIEDPFRREIKFISLDQSISIQVKPKHVCKMLKKYLDGQISEYYLSNWAAIIYMLPVFVPEGKTEEDCSNEGEELLWTTIQKIGSPNFYEEISETKIMNYLNLLSC